MKAEHRIHNGQHYERVRFEVDDPAEFWRKERACPDGDLPPTNGAPDVMCSGCDGVVFRLYYGRNEIFAECVACGAEDSVYSG